jgi:RNA polymerase sigma factor (sigma-70 family)
MSLSAANDPTRKEVELIVDAFTRSESGKLLSVLTRIFGFRQLEMAEDIVQDTLLKALEKWTATGIPDNPGAWLLTTARNKAIDAIRKFRRQYTFATDISNLLGSEYTAVSTVDNCFREEEIRDDQLRMMFACCHPSIPREGQIALILKTLCGFSLAQIARAFIVPPDTVEKRLYRARIAFRENNQAFEIPTGKMLQNNLDSVLESIYLLFNEAYSLGDHESLIRKDLAGESIRLCGLLTEHSATKVPKTDALLALLCFHTSRLSGRTDKQGDLLLMKEQDRSCWDQQMIQTGVFYLTRSAAGNEMSRYHLEAAIAYEHCKAVDFNHTDWSAILHYYDLLIALIPSQVVLLNRAIVVNQLEGPARALLAIRSIPGIDYLGNYYLLHAIVAELNRQMGEKEIAIRHFEKARSLAVSTAERRFIQKKLQELI